MSVLSTLVLFVTITTLIFAVGAYLAFKMKESRLPLQAKRNRAKKGAAASDESMLQPYVPKDRD